MGALTSSDPGNVQETIQVKSESHTGLQPECTVHPNWTGMKVIRHAGVDSRMISFDDQARQQMTCHFWLSIQCNAKEYNSLCSLNQETATPVRDIHILHVEQQILPTEGRGSHGKSTVASCGKHLHGALWAIESARLKPATWLRYVDDTFVVWNERRDKLQDFLEHLNAIRPSIQCTMELEKDKNPPFLDVLVTWGADKLTKTVYRKAFYTDWYIHFTSNHHNRVKWGVIKCLKWRATRICETKRRTT